MKFVLTGLSIFYALFGSVNEASALTNSDVSVRLISGYFWMDNSCAAAGPQGKVVSFRIVNTKGSLLRGVRFSLGNMVFTDTGAVSYTGGTPSFLCRTSSSMYIGDIAAGDSVTAFFFVGYNCLSYANNTNITTDYLTLPVTISDNLSGTVARSFKKLIYVLRNSNNNTITILATSTNTIGTLATISVAYNISNVKPGNIVDMEISTLNTFPAGYEILGCKITATSIPTDYPVGLLNTHYTNSIVSNLPSGGTVTIVWTLKITGTQTGLNSSNLTPFVVSDAGSAQRWQANTTSFTGTSTPVNPITISKRVNHQNVETGDSVVYTIVLRNSSATTAVMIDRLLDNLPRDYKFQYIQTDTSIFPRLVTYNNSTLYPVFNDTNYLEFFGNKRIDSSTFSWVVPRRDSVKLIYSAVVSEIPGLNDTNFVSAYVGSSNIGTAFAKVNVFTLLPLKVLSFEAKQSSNFVHLNWKVNEVISGVWFEVIRLDLEKNTTMVIANLPGDQMKLNFSCVDELFNEQSANSISYELRVHHPEAKSTSFFTHLDIDNTNKPYNVTYKNGSFNIYSKQSNTRKIEVKIYDFSGRQLYAETMSASEGIFSLSNSGLISTQYVMVCINDGLQTYSEKVFVE